MLPGQGVSLDLQLLPALLEVRELLLVPLAGSIEVPRRRSPGHVAGLADQEPFEGDGFDLSYRIRF